jgi:hypothetical protein
MASLAPDGLKRNILELDGFLIVKLEPTRFGGFVAF